MKMNKKQVGWLSDGNAFFHMNSVGGAGRDRAGLTPVFIEIPAMISRLELAKRAATGWGSLGTRDFERMLREVIESQGLSPDEELPEAE